MANGRVVELPCVVMERHHPPRIEGAERGDPECANFALPAALEEMKNRAALMNTAHKRDEVAPRRFQPA